NQNQFVRVKSSLIGAGRRNRLQFEIHTFKAGSCKCLPQTRNSKVIVFWCLSADKSNWAAHHRIANRLFELQCSMFAQIAEHAGDQVFQLVAAAKYFRSCERSAGKMRLERLDQTPFFFGLEITLNRGWACERGRSPQPVSCPELFKIKDGAK